MYPSGWLFWWFIPRGAALKKEHVAAALKENGLTLRHLTKSKYLDVFAFAVERAKKKFRKTYKIDQIERKKSRYSYGVSTCTTQNKYKCKRVIHHHEANISCTESSGNITKTANHPVTNYIHKKYEEFKGYTPLSRFTLAVRDYIQTNTHAISVIARGGIWFITDEDRKAINSIQDTFNKLMSYDTSNNSIIFHIQEQVMTPTFLSILHSAIKYKLDVDYAQFDKNLDYRISKIFVRPFTENALSLWFKKTNALNRLPNKYRDLYDFEFDDYFGLISEFNNRIISAVVDDPVQHEKIKQLYGVE